MPASSSACAGGLHLRLVVLRAHDDPDVGRVDVDLLERLLDRRHRLGLRRRAGLGGPDDPLGWGSSEISLISFLSGCRQLGTRSTARAAMSVRICIPSKEIRLAASYARSRAAAGVGAERGHVQHPAAGGDDLAVARGGAGVGHLGQLGRRVEAADHVALRGALRVAGRGEHQGHRPVGRRTRRSTPARPPGSRAARKRSSRSERSRGSTACVSGSPKRTLNSSTLGPSAPIISPA